MQPLFEDIMQRFEGLFADFKKAISGLSVEALDWVPGPEMNSLGVLAVHVAGATRYWASDMTGGVGVPRSRSDEFAAQGADVAHLAELLDDCLADVKIALDRLTPDDLTRSVASEPHGGRTFRVSWSLLHALEHLALHVGHAQITRQLIDQRQG